MDPIGPWYATYNRLATTSTIPTTFQATSSPTVLTAAAVDQNQIVPAATVNIQTVSSSASPQILLQTAGPGSTVTLAGQSSFNPGGFLSTPTAVGYDVLSSLFQHSNTKQTTTPHYVSSHQYAQTNNIAHILTSNLASTKQPTSLLLETDIPALRTSCSAPQQNDTFYDQTSSGSPSTVSWNLSHPTNTQLSSPFGILPHESVKVTTPTNPVTTTTVSSGVTYDNPYAAQKNRTESPINNNGNSYFQETSGFNSEGLNNSYSSGGQQVSNTVAQSSLHHQSCIVTTPNATNSNRISVPTAIFLNVQPQDKQALSEHADHDNSQSSPISYSIMDSRNLSYATGNTNKQQSNGTTVQFHVLNQPQQPSSCRLYSNNTTESEYHHPVRSKSAASTDSAYSSNTSQNGPDCAGVVPRRPSPLQTHSQASPLGHVPSPASYPMYNSPMASMSSPSPLQQQQHVDGAASTPYKTTNVQQQMTPPSPLEVAVTRSPSQQGQVVYSSVITRALGANENNKTSYSTDASSGSTFDQTQDFNQTKQMCWENSNSNYLTTENTGANVLQRISNNQSSCMETNQISLQDLSRGESINIVKNIPPIQTNAASDNEDGHHNLIKRKDTAASQVDYLDRIPPPAHHNTILQQPQQNGYVELERWNLTTIPHAKIITAPAATFVAQQQMQQQQPQQIHHTTNFVTSTQPPLLVAHHQPTVSYFPTFQLTQTQVASLQHQPQQHPALQSTVDLSAISLDSSSCQQTTSCDIDIKDDRPQVIVPNIEEELEFLQQSGIMNVNSPVVNNQQAVSQELKRGTNGEPNSGFMTSYLKFLQGEKDTSPPLPGRGRKPSYNTTGNSKPYIPAESIDKNVTSAKNTPTIDYANDPRYFPLPKERKKRKFDSSDDGFSSDEEAQVVATAPRKQRIEKKEKVKVERPVMQVAPMVNTVTEGVKKKGRPIKPGGPTDRKRKAAAAAAAAAEAAAAQGITTQPDEDKKPQQTPRRESSRRKAKENSSVKEILESQRNADPYDEEEQGDSDADPAWTPAAKSPGEEEASRKRRGRPPVISKKKNYLDEYTSQPSVPSKRGRKKKNQFDVAARSNAIKLSCKIDEKLLASVSDEDIDISPFKHSTFGDDDDSSGEFVVIKSDLNQEYPPLWRIDGKTLLQKYEPFQSNGKTLYRNISTYSGWAPQNRHTYQQVPVKFWQQGKVETIVEFLREDLIINDSECISKFMKETEKYQDNFEVYIQTLISQALDSNFLTEIFQEQDDYFLSNVKTVDEITDERKQRLLATTNWKQSVITALSTWPCINVLRDNMTEHKGKSCAGCNRVKIYARVLLYGQPYNSTTLEGSPPDPQVPQEKDFIFCRVCQTKVGLFNKVAHQKYLMFLECARRVADKRLADPQKDTTIILNELLADEPWLNQLFKDVRMIWAEVDSIHQQMTKRKGNTTDAANTADNPRVAEASNESQTMTYNEQISGTVS